MSGGRARPRVAFQGVFGAFSHEACLACLPDADPVPHNLFEDVFEAVRSGDCDLGFVPVENSTAGPVPEVAEGLPRSGLEVLSEHAWPIRLQLMANPGAELSGLRVVASHPMALKQCGVFLQSHGLAGEAGYDTAGAAKALAERPDLARAAVGPAKAAELYGLTILAADIQDRSDNLTRFFVLRSPKE